MVFSERQLESVSIVDNLGVFDGSLVVSKLPVVDGDRVGLLEVDR